MVTHRFFLLVLNMSGAMGNAASLTGLSCPAAASGALRERYLWQREQAEREIKERFEGDEAESREFTRWSPRTLRERAAPEFAEPLAPSCVPGVKVSWLSPESSAARSSPT
jgi:hypothetical protein